MSMLRFFRFTVFQTTWVATSEFRLKHPLTSCASERKTVKHLQTDRTSLPQGWNTEKMIEISPSFLVSYVPFTLCRTGVEYRERYSSQPFFSALWTLYIFSCISDLTVSGIRRNRSQVAYIQSLNTRCLPAFTDMPKKYLVQGNSIAFQPEKGGI